MYKDVIKQFTKKKKKGRIGRLFGFYGISTFVGYLMRNLFLYK